MSDAELDVPGATAPVRNGLQITEDISGTRLCLDWNGSRPWGWLRVIVPLLIVAVFVALGSGPRGPWKLAWEQLLAPGPRDIGNDILLGVMVCGGLLMAWIGCSSLGQFAGYWGQVCFDANEALLTAERRGWGLWGRKSYAIPFPKLQSCSLRTGREGREALTIDLNILYGGDRRDPAQFMTLQLECLSFQFALRNCDTRERALELLFSIGRILSCSGYINGEDTPLHASWSLSLPYAGANHSQVAVTDEYAQDAIERPSSADLEDDEDDDGVEIQVIPIPVTADFGRQSDDSKGARSGRVDPRVAAQVDLDALRDKLVFSRIVDWKPGEHVCFVRDRAPALVFVVAAVFGGIVGGAIGGWPLFGFLEALLGNGSVWWPGALGLPAAAGACALGFVAWNQLQEQSVDIDWRTQTIEVQSCGQRLERPFDAFRGLVLSGKSRTQGTSPDGGLEYGCRLDLILTDRDIPLLTTDSWESNQSAARNVLQPLATSLAQALGLKCDWENRHQTDAATIRRILKLTVAQQLVLATLGIIAVVGIAQGFRQRDVRADAGKAIRELGGNAVFMNGFSMRNKSVYRDFWKVEFENDTDVDAHLLRLRPALLKVPELGIEVSRCPLTDAGLRGLDQVIGLRVLTATQTRISDAGLPALRGCQELVYLNLYGSNITDDGLVNLEGLSKLRYLFLGGSQITDRGLAKIGSLPALEFLELNNSAITAEGIDRLRAARPFLEIDAKPAEGP